MKTNILFKTMAALGVLVFASAGCAISGQVPAAGSMLPGGEDKWQLAWSDEFDYPDANLDSRWESQNGPSGHILCSRWRENAKVSDGTLKLLNKKEKRGGQEWTSGNLWTREKFLYGYFECRYRYAAAEGTNNSFWLMTKNKGQPEQGKNFEIDINEGHYPNKVNTNIHNWTDVKVVNGKKTHPSASRSVSFGQKPDCTIQLEIPVTTRRIRFSSEHPIYFHMPEFRVYNVNPAGYPDAMSPSADTDKPGLVNFARDAATKVTVSGFYKPDSEKTLANITDGKLGTDWITQKEGTKWLELEFAEDKTVGCVQFVTGWKDKGKWTNLVNDYKVQYHNGQKWVDMASFNASDGKVNLARDFHTYGLEWSEKELVFYFDGKEIRREKNEFCYSPAPVWLSLAIIPWAGHVTDGINGTFMEVDYVRIYKRK